MQQDTVSSITCQTQCVMLQLARKAATAEMYDNIHPPSQSTLLFIHMLAQSAQNYPGVALQVNTIHSCLSMPMHSHDSQGFPLSKWL